MLTCYKDEIAEWQECDQEKTKQKHEKEGPTRVLVLPTNQLFCLLYEVGERIKDKHGHEQFASHVTHLLEQTSFLPLELWIPSFFIINECVVIIPTQIIC